MDAVSSIGPTVKVGSARDVQSHAEAAQPRLRAEPEPVSVEVVDPVSLSKESRIRQDIVTDSESAEEQSRDAFRDRFAASGEERDRLRELAQRDLEMRASGSAEGIDRALKSLPSFEVDIGPFGRAYAVGDGAALERPQSPELVLPAEDKPEPEFPPELELQRVESEGIADPASPTSAERPEPGSQVVSEYGSERLERRDASGNEESSTSTGEDLPSPALSERTARAYQSAASMSHAPGGVVPTTFEALG